MSTTLEEFLQEVARITPPILPTQIEYRIHYNDAGDITACSMADHPAGSTQYLVVDKATYDSYHMYHKVVDKTLKKLDIVVNYRVQLVKCSIGPYATVKNLAGVLLEPDESCTEVEYYEQRNNN